MSFEGDLEHLPIVDVIQLLHATGKSGTLTLRSQKGESQLVFHNGYIVSANHVDNSVRIGQILLDMGKISEDVLEDALFQQQKAGRNAKPIMQTLIEGGRVQPEVAYQGLETLIEMTIVEVLTWTRGTFCLDVNKFVVSDEYRYFPEQLKKEIQLNTQSVLMDALRIYDERKRDGTLSSEAMFGPARQSAPAPSGEEISDADLGLDALDELERVIPQFFSGLDASESETTERRVQQLLGGVPAEEQRRLASYLDQLAQAAQHPDDDTGVILVTGDKLLRECVQAVCGPRFILATDDAAGVDAIMDHSLAKGRVPLLLLDAGEPGSRGADREAMVAVVRAKREKYPELALVLLAAPGDYRLTVRALQSGASAVLPRASREERPQSLVQDTIDCSQALESYLGKARTQPGQGLLQQFKRQFVAISEQKEPPEVTFQLLKAVGAVFDRVVTLVLVRSELIAERGLGISADGGPLSVKLRVPVADPSLFQQVLAGESYYGNADATVQSTIFATLGAPASQKILLLPVESFGRVIAVIYGDFGARAGGDPQPELLETLALHAGLAIDNALYRKRCAQKATS